MEGKQNKIIIYWSATVHIVKHKVYCVCVTIILMKAAETLPDIHHKKIIIVIV